jgi:type IV pilus assembly protein PilC
MKFKFEGYDRQAQLIRGELDANSPEEAQSTLRNRMIRPRKLVLVKSASTSSEPNNSYSQASSTSHSSKKATIQSSTSSLAGLFDSQKPSLSDFTAFIRQLATMQGAGIPLVQSLTILSDQVENRSFGGVLSSIVARIQEGSSFTDALRNYPEIFDKIFINLVSAGETSGSLEAILLRLSTYYEKAASLRRKIRSAMTYPVVTLVLVIGVLIGMLVFVVPVFENMFASNKKALPWATDMIIRVSKDFKSHFYYYFAAISGTVIFTIYSFKNEQSRRALDPYLLTIPVFGKLMLKASLARFTRTLGTMLQSGVPFLDSLDITARVSGNAVLEDAVLKAKNDIKEGQGLATSMQSSLIFPKMLVGMVNVGEQTGSMDQMLTKVADFYEDEVDATVNALSSILEPLMIITVGIIVLCILIPLYLPVFQMGDVIGG